MAHDTVRNGPCALPDGHSGPHRTLQGLHVYQASQARYRASEKNRLAARRYSASEKGKRKKMQWLHSHPVKKALAQIKYGAKQRKGA